MPDQKESLHFESGLATAPLVGCCSLLDSPSEEYIDYSEAASRNSPAENNTVALQSLSYSPNNYNCQKIESCISDYNPCFSSHPYSLPATSKVLGTNLSFESPEHLADYSHIPLSPILSSFSSPSSSNNIYNNIDNFSSIITSNNNNNLIDFTSSSPKKQEDIYKTTESCWPTGHVSSLFNYSRISKPVPFSTLRNTSNYLNTLISLKAQLNEESIDLCLEKSSKLKNNSEDPQLLLKPNKDDHFEESQQLVPKNGAKLQNPEVHNQDLVTDSFHHFFCNKSSQDNLSSDPSDINSVLISLKSKYSSEEVSFTKKKSKEDFKLMNDFLTKVILEREEKRFKSAVEKKKIFHEESFDDLSHEIEERKAKRDAMSHYQEDKNHHKRSSNYGDYNQWEYFGQQDIQSSNNHNRRGHFSFGGSSQQHSVGWNPVGIGMPRQSNPYYTNPHNHVMPAHAHSDYRYNQWNNPNHKNIPNVHNAHSQNTILAPSKIDIKHHADISNSVQDFGLPIGSTSDFSKFRQASRDLVHRSPPNLSEKSTRTGMHSDHLAPISSAIRNSSSMRAPAISGHPKSVINNPLSDLQMLVTNQDSENLPQKADSFQQETVDLSAHSEISKQKENVQNKSLNGKSEEIIEFRSSVSVIQIQNKQVKSDFRESEKAVELTSKCIEKTTEILSPRPPSRNDVEYKNVSDENIVESIKKTVQNDVKSCEEPVKTSVIVGKDGEPSIGGTKIEKDITESFRNSGSKSEVKGAEIEDKEKKSAEEVVRQESSTKSNCLLEETKEVQKSKTANEHISKEFSGDSKTEYSEEAENIRKSKRKAEDEQASGEKKKVLLEVDSQQEKLGEIFEVGKPNLLTVSSTSAENKPVVEIIKKTPKKKPLRKSRIGRLSSGQSSGSERSLLSKKSKSLGNKEDSKKKIKKSLCDVMDRRGPFLHVEGSKESPVSVIVVNFPKGDDEDEKEKSSAKKLTLNASRTRHHNELDYRGRSRNGLYSSTLSARYDARTTDHTWVCVFCKKGPHYNTMGDLFGPYIISKDENVSLGDFSGDEKDISDAQKRGGRNKKSIRSNNMVEHFQKMSRKLRRTQSTESCLTGMTVISDDQVDQLRYEVWVHEQCAVWSANVFLIGSRIIGMQEAIWCSVKTICSKCGISGANIGCVYRNCPNRSHYHCAKESGWSLEQDTFISTCHIHKSRS